MTALIRLTLSHRQLEGELHRMWKNFGIAMEKEYQASKGRRRKR